MANVTGKFTDLLPAAFRHKGKAYKQGEEITLSAHAAASYERLGWLKLPKADSDKVEEAVTVKEAKKK